jgi:hypothetical protein
MSESYTSMNAVMIQFETPRQKRKFSDAQLSILEALKDNWILLKDHNTFDWYLKKKGEKPFTTLRVNLDKTSVNVLVETNQIKYKDRCINTKHMIYVAK